MKTFAPAALAIALFAGAAQPAMAQTSPAAPPAADSMFRATTLNLSAYGEVRVAPDMANITLGVLTESKTAVEAMNQNATKMSAMIDALRRQGISEKDIQTSNLNLNPQYLYQENKPPQLTGYQASNNVTIRVLDLKKLGVAIDAVVGAGANQINGINFGLQNPQAAEDAARKMAVRALTSKAQLYAEATNHGIRRLVSLSEGGGYNPPPPMPMAMMMRESKAMDSSTPIAGGELVIRVDVTGLYEIGR